METALKKEGQEITPVKKLEVLENAKSANPEDLARELVSLYSDIDLSGNYADKDVARVLAIANAAVYISLQTEGKNKGLEAFIDSCADQLMSVYNRYPRLNEQLLPFLVSRGHEAIEKRGFA